MCELFGVSSKQNVYINNYLKSFYKHCNMHPHGWGLALTQKDQLLADKEPIRASDSQHLKSILNKPLYTKNALAHIRLATMGNINILNCHPYIQKDNTERTWTLIHNGTIFECDKLNKYKTIQQGNTDSERILLYLVDKINQEEKEKPLTDKEQFNLINNIITKLAKGNKLNLLLFNGTYLYVHSNTEDSLHYYKTKDTIYFSTQQLNEKEWKNVPLNTVLVIKNGEIVYKGKPHEYKYKLTQSQFNFIMNNVSPSLRESIINNFGEMNEAEFLKNHG